MITVYKFQDYETTGVSPVVLYEHTKRFMENPWIWKYTWRKALVIPIPSSVSIIKHEYSDIKAGFKLENYTKKLFSFSDTVYIHPRCTIPRAKVAEKYKRTIKPNKADICIIPKLAIYYETRTLAIFLNKEEGRIYCVEPQEGWINNKHITIGIEPCNKSLGITPLDINPDIARIFVSDDSRKPYSHLWSNDNWKAFQKSSLVFYGQAFIVEPKEDWIGDILYKKLCNIVTEQDILATLGDTNNSLDKETVDSIKEMLSSSDKATIELGLKTLAELDYNKYRNTAAYLLYSTRGSWATKRGIKINTSVKYMLKYLHAENNRLFFSDTITEEDYALIQPLIRECFWDAYTSFEGALKSKFPFADFNVNVNYTINPILSRAKKKRREQ